MKNDKNLKAQRKLHGESQEIRIGDKVWWYHKEAILEVINIDATHAHLRNIHGVMSWEPLEKLNKVIETVPAFPVA